MTAGAKCGVCGRRATVADVYDYPTVIIKRNGQVVRSSTERATFYCDRCAPPDPPVSRATRLRT